MVNRLPLFFHGIIIFITYYVLLPESIIEQDWTNYHLIGQDKFTLSPHLIADKILDGNVPLSYTTSLVFLYFNFILTLLPFDYYLLTGIFINIILLVYALNKNILGLNARQKTIYIYLIIFNIGIFMLVGYAFRQSLAISLYLILRNDQKLNLLLLLIISVTIHLSVLFFIFIELKHINIKYRVFSIAVLSIMFAFLFFSLAPLLGNIENKFLSTNAAVCLGLMMLLLVRTGVNLTSDIPIFMISFFGYSFYNGIGDLEFYRLLPIFVILALMSVRKITLLHIGALWLNVLYLAFFLTQRNILDATGI